MCPCARYIDDDDQAAGGVRCLIGICSLVYLDGHCYRIWLTKIHEAYSNPYHAVAS